MAHKLMPTNKIQWEKPPTQIEMPFGVVMLEDGLKEKITSILIELKKRYDEEMKWCKSIENISHFSGGISYEEDEHDECFARNHRDNATAHAHAYFLVAKTFNLTTKEAWSLIKPYLEEGSNPPANYP
jgi:hypothetical protein